MSNNAAPVSPYKASRIVNAHLLEDGFDKVLPAQMFYNYSTARVRAGKVPFIPVNEAGKIELADLAVWYDKYVAKNLQTAKA